MNRILTFLVLVLSGCATSPGTSEAEREVVLQYLGTDVGTAGPFAKQAKKELGILSPKDQADAVALLGRGAVAFLIYERGSAGATRIVLIRKGHVVGDFRAAKEPNKSPEPTPTAVTPRADVRNDE